jgi:hypothetical protein
MSFLRKELVDILDVTKPALASKDLIEELTQFWFKGDCVYAYNDIIGLQHPLKTDFVGGLRGSLLLGLLDKSRAKDIHIEPLQNGEDQKEMLIRAANTRLTLALLDDSRALWEIPSFDKAKSVVFGKSFLEVIESVLVSVGGDTSVPDQLGVTIEPNNKFLDFYTTDSLCISWARLPLPENYNCGRIILPEVFCEQLLRLFKDGGYLVISEDSVAAQNSKGVYLYSRLIETNNPLDFSGQIRESIPKDYDKLLVDIPSRLKLAIERILIVLQNSPPGESARIFIDKGNILRLYVKTSIGEIKDSMKIIQEHEDIAVDADPILIKRVLQGREKFLLSDKCILLTGPKNFVHLISLSS